MTEATTPEPQLNRAGRRAESRRLRKAGALMAAIPAAFGTTALVVGATTGTAGAADLVVTNLAPSGAGSLHDVAEGAGNGDVITFQAGLTGEIHLDDTIDITTSITINGPGAGVIIVSGDTGNDGSKDVRLFDIQGPGSDIDVTITGLTLTEGTASTGGAIRFDEANLTIRDAVLTDNSVDNDGGAIASDGNDLTLRIESSELSGNVADDDGGAVYFYVDGGTFVMTDSTVSDNEADDEGGGLEIATEDDGVTSATIVGGTISDNTAGGRGGGVFVYNVYGDVSITGTTISGNTASRGGGGLGIQDVRGATTFTNVVVSDNHAVEGNDGGGVYFEYVKDATITGSTFTGNSAYDGGAVEWIRSYDLLIRNSTLSGNTARRGGGLYNSVANYGNVTIVNSTISGNVATGTNAGDGGAIRQGSYYTLTIIQSTIADNTGTQVGGIDMYDLNADSVGARANDGAVHASERAAERAAEGRAASTQVRTRSGRVHQADVDAVVIVGTILQGNSGVDVGFVRTISAASSILGSISGTTLSDLGGNLQGVDPLLGPLQDNGGPTQTHALLDGSPAINAGPDPVPDFPGNADDQRGPGYPRVTGGRVDIGAFEVQPTNIEPNFTG